MIAGTCALLGAAAGCKNKGDANAAPDPAALKAQQELIARRDALVTQREQLLRESSHLDAEIQRVSGEGGDTADLAKKKAEVDAKLEGQSKALQSVESDVVKQSAGAGNAAELTAAIATREASMGSREKGVATREAQLAERERVLAQRERELAQREKETCSGGGGVIIQQVAAPKGANYTRRDIEPLLAKARAKMQKKGLNAAAGDLGPAAALESEATKAMADADWGKAYLAAAQLSATVDSIKIDRAFIGAKISRLNARLKNAKVDEATRQQLEQGLTDVVQKFGDGKLADANSKLNQMWALSGR